MYAIVLVDFGGSWTHPIRLERYSPALSSLQAIADCPTMSSCFPVPASSPRSVG